MIEDKSITVIVPTYNRPLFLGRAIDSLARQHKKSLIKKIVLVNDAGITPVDYDLDIPVEVITHSENRGAAAAVESGIANCDSEWLMFLDDDDCLHRNHLAVLNEWESSLGANFFHSDAVLFGYEFNSDGSVNEKWSKIFAYKTSPKEMREFSTYMPSGSLIRSSYIRMIGGIDTSIKNHWDWDLYLRAMEYEMPVHIPEATVKYAIHHAASDTKNISGALDNTKSSLDILCEKHGLGKLPAANFLTLLDTDAMKSRESETRNHWLLQN